MKSPYLEVFDKFPCVAKLVSPKQPEGSISWMIEEMARVFKIGPGGFIREFCMSLPDSVVKKNDTGNSFVFSDGSEMKFELLSEKESLVVQDFYDNVYRNLK